MADIKYVSELNFKRGLKGVVDWIKSKFVVGGPLDEGGGYVSGFKFQHSIESGYKMYIARPNYSEIASYTPPEGSDQEMSIALANEVFHKWTFKHGAEPNKIDSIKLNGVALTPDSNKVVEVNTGQLRISTTNGVQDQAQFNGYQNDGKENYAHFTHTTNGVRFTTGIDDNEATTGISVDLPDEARVQALIADELAGITGVDFVVVSTLPTTGEKGKFYLVANPTATGSNIYDEYVWVNKGTPETPDYAFERLGTMDVDLTDYTKESDFVALTNDEVDAVLVEIGVKTATPTP